MPTTPAPDDGVLSHPLTVAQLNARKTLHFDLEPDMDQRAALAAELGLMAVRKLRFKGSLKPLGRKDWELQADLGATVVQPCTVTLDPVTTRIDEAVTRRFLADMPEPEGLEVEMPQDDTLEPLPAVLDLGLIATEALVLALPQWPRSDGAALPDDGAIRTAPPGQQPVTDAEIRPFAALASLRDKLGDKKG